MLKDGAEIHWYCAITAVEITRYIPGLIFGIQIIRKEIK